MAKKYSYDIPPQPMYIYDKKKKHKLVFDGVIKVEHTVALKIEDDPANAKAGDGFINNAKNEANEVAFDVIMSPVYTTKNDLAGSSGNRSKNAYTTLLEIKNNRRKIQVITTLKTYNNMLIKSIQIVQDENNPYGFEGTIVFHEVIEPPAAPPVPQNDPPQDDGSGARTPAYFENFTRNQIGET